MKIGKALQLTNPSYGLNNMIPEVPKIDGLSVECKNRIKKKG